MIAGEAGALQFTPGYAAPEILHAYASKQTIAAQPSQDVWALGAMVYEALTNTKVVPPFAAVADLLAMASGSAAYPWESSPRHPQFERSKVRPQSCARIPL